MKKLLSLILAAAFLVVSPDLPVESPARAQAAPVVLMVAAVATMTGIVIYVWKTNTAQKLRWLVLNDDDLAGHLTPVVTNQVFVGPNLALALPAFEVYTDSHSPQGFWRVTELSVAPTNWVPQSVQTVYARISPL